MAVRVIDDNDKFITVENGQLTGRDSFQTALKLNTYIQNKNTLRSYGSGTVGSIFFKQTGTGNFSTSNKFYFDSLNTRLMMGGTGLSHSPQSRFSILADSTRSASATKYMFNFTDPSINKQRGTWPFATDSSSFSLEFTPVTGKSIFKIMDNVGMNKLTLDSAGGITIGNTTLSGIDGALKTAGAITAGSGLNVTTGGAAIIGTSVFTVLS